MILDLNLQLSYEALFTIHPVEIPLNELLYKNTIKYYIINFNYEHFKVTKLLVHFSL